jgi:hypothetical protein
MKKLLFIMLLLGVTGYSQQNYRIRNEDASGNLINYGPTVTATEPGVVYNLDKNKSNTGPMATHHTAIYNGETYPVFMSSRGKLFIYVISKKTGNKYKKYL